MAELIYQRDAYAQTFEAEVTASDPEKGCVSLDRTAFFPGGGGQPCDLGHLALEHAKCQ